MRLSMITLGAALTLGLVAHTSAAESDQAQARLKGADGSDRGSATFTQTPAGVLFKAELSGFPPGEHAFHIHEVGECEPPFKSAGGHFNPTDAKHGFMSPEGPHAGDMPNIHVPDSGELTISVLNTYVSLDKNAPNSLRGGEGTALMVHAGADDHESDPAGDAGERIACGVIE